VIYVFSNDSIYKKSGDGVWVRGAALPSDLFPIFMTVDPHDPATVWTGGQEHLLRSENGGQSWNSARTGIGPDEFLSGIAIDPHDADHLFVWGDQTYESSDGGATWHAAAGVERGMALAFDPTTAGVSYQHGYGPVKVTRDGGQTWSSLGGGEGFVDSMELAVSADGLTLYAGGVDSAVWVWDSRNRKRRAVR
jgi:photosystem II stability/assembly factor-like uncharacterized protein